jgi:NAD(P) transhydrogenase subunit beta
MAWVQTLIDACYFLAALLFILGLKRMSSPRTARGGIVWAGYGMLVAVIATLFLPDMQNRGLIIGAVLIGVAAAWWSGRRVAMTAMPQMVALYNGMGGGAAAAIGATELISHVGGLAAVNGVVAPNTFPLAPESWSPLHGVATVIAPLSPVALALGVLGALIGSVSFSGSLIAFAKLQGWMDRRFVFPGQRVVNMLVLAAAVVIGVMLAMGHLTLPLIGAFFLLALLFGLLMTLPIGGADMPVVISLYNAFTGLAVAFEGYVLHNEAMIIAGMVVGAAGTLLTQLMAKAMNRSIGNVLFGSFGAASASRRKRSAEARSRSKPRMPR